MERGRDSSNRSSRSIRKEQLFSNLGLKRCERLQTLAAERKDFGQAAMSPVASSRAGGLDQEGRVMGRNRGSRSQAFRRYQLVNSNEPQFIHILFLVLVLPDPLNTHKSIPLRWR
jgi:hypothetical protein